MSTSDDLQNLKFSAGERILTQGQDGNKAYMILSGSVRVFLEDGTKIVELATLGKDEIFGESAILTGEPYGAHVEAIDDIELRVITPETLSDMLQSTDPIIRALVQMLITRLKSTNEALLKSETREFIDVALI